MNLFIFTEVDIMQYGNAGFKNHMQPRQLNIYKNKVKNRLFIEKFSNKHKQKKEDCDMLLKVKKNYYYSLIHYFQNLLINDIEYLLGIIH